MPLQFTPEPRPHAILRRLILTLIVVLVAWAVLLAFSGGFVFHVAGLRLRSRDPDNALYAAFALTAVYVSLYRHHLRRHAHEAVALFRDLSGLERVALPVTLLLSIIVCALGITHGVRVAGGSDSWGYVSQADLWLQGTLVVEQPIARQAFWPDADRTFTPLGYVPALHAGAIVPMYAPGLPLLMALAKTVLGACGPFVVTPVLGGLTVSLTYLLGTQLWSPLVGVAGATLMATSPPFLFMLMSPMSDVPVAAFFVLALVIGLSRWRSRAFWTGIAVSVATLIRPNLAPLATIYLVFLMLRARSVDPAQRSRAMWRSALLFCVGVAPSMLFMAVVNTHLYGAPWKSGYGTLDHLYAWQWVWPNVVNYSRSVWQQETAFILLMSVPLLLRRRLPPQSRSAVVFITCFALGVWLSYLAYEPFATWWFLRFFLSAFPVMLVLAVMGLVLLLRPVNNARTRRAVAIVIVLLVASARARTAYGEQVFQLWKQGVSYVSAAEYVRQRLPANAVIVSGLHSGSIRYHANRLSMRWDGISESLWPRVLTFMVEHGYQPYVLVTDMEEETLRRQFGSDGLGTLIAVLEKPERIRIYDPLRHSSPLPLTIPPLVPCPCGCLESMSPAAAVR